MKIPKCWVKTAGLKFDLVQYTLSEELALVVISDDVVEAWHDGYTCEVYKDAGSGGFVVGALHDGLWRLPEDNGMRLPSGHQQPYTAAYWHGHYIGSNWSTIAYAKTNT